MSYNQQVRIIHWNSQGISNTSKMVQLEELLERKRIDICLLNETFLKDHHKFQMTNYKVHRNDRDDRFGGGVAILVRNTINHKLLPLTKTNKIENISIEMKIQNKTIVITSAYSPSYGTNFGNDVLGLCPSTKEFIVFGDFNARHTSWNCSNNNTAGKILFDLQNKSNFFIFNTDSPTYIPHQQNRSSSTIDIILSNSTLDLTNIFTLENTLMTDHIPICCIINQASIEENKNVYLDYKNADWEKFRDFIENRVVINNNFNSSVSIDLEIQKLTSLIIQARDSTIKTFHQQQRYEIDKSTGIAIKFRNFVRRKHQRANADEKLFYKSLLAQANQLIKKRIDCNSNKKWNELLSKMKPGDKRFWSASKNLRGKNNKFPAKLIVDDTAIITPEDKANALAEHFQKSHELTSNMTHSIDRKVNQTTRRLSNIQRFSVGNIITTAEMSLILKELKPSKSPGLDDVSNRLLKNLPMKGIQKLVDIFNACLKLGYFPNEFKKAKVIPIAKPGKNVKLPSSYRPISLLSNIGKILEKLLLSRIQQHTETNNIIPEEQFGFRKQHSTTHQTKRISSMIKKNKRLRLSTGLILFDIEKAFDSVWHAGLVYKLVKFNYPTYICKCIESFLSNRSFGVSIDGISSNPKPIAAGVPQGSILSPLLYSIFTSDYNPPSYVDVAYYADDTAIIIRTKTTKALIKRMEKAMISHIKYFQKWKIRINTTKTQAIIFPYSKSPRLKPKRKLKIDNEEVEFSKSVTYLGVIFDQNLNYKDHINLTLKKSTKAFRSLYPLLSRNSHLSWQNKNLLYKCVIRAVWIHALQR